VSLILPCIYRQSGERVIIPCPSAGHRSSVFHHGEGYGSPVSPLMVVVNVMLGEKKRARKQFKNLLLPYLYARREKGE